MCPRHQQSQPGTEKNPDYQFHFSKLFSNAPIHITTPTWVIFMHSPEKIDKIKFA